MFFGAGLAEKLAGSLAKKAEGKPEEELGESEFTKGDGFAALMKNWKKMGRGERAAGILGQLGQGFGGAARMASPTAQPGAGAPGEGEFSPSNLAGLWENMQQNPEMKRRFMEYLSKRQRGQPQGSGPQMPQLDPSRFPGGGIGQGQPMQRGFR